MTIYTNLFNVMLFNIKRRKNNKKGAKMEEKFYIPVNGNGNNSYNIDISE